MKRSNLLTLTETRVLGRSNHKLHLDSKEKLHLVAVEKVSYKLETHLKLCSVVHASIGDRQNLEDYKD